MTERARGTDSSPTIHLAMAVGDSATAVAVDIDGGVELFECPTSVILTDDGRVELAQAPAGIRGFVSQIGNPYGIRLHDGRVVRAEDLVAGFAHTLMRTMSELYSLPADARCTIAYPSVLSAEAVEALRDALDYVGLSQCVLSAATDDDVAVAARALSPDASAASTSRTSDKAFAAMVAESASTRRRRVRAGTPTRAGIAVAAVALVVLAVGGAVGSVDRQSNTVEPLNSQQAITPAAPVVTSTLEPTTTDAPAPVQDAPPVEPEPVYVDTPDPVEQPVAPPVVETTVPDQGLFSDRFPFGAPDIDFPDFPTLPQVTVPTAPTATTTAPGTTADTSTTTSAVVPSVAAPRVIPFLPVSRP
ncbi:hypothetical protein [Rhodococcus sp. MEB064]|uniref:hypothetical protein n=1 Tax=Rhodococcus sp. MEB064 TaxID=1587522 RepID=UPI0005AC199B|nr:hypothetical protein [Rhodococcus sp. MEB064]KIQ14120.1 hypothetical protein RU01_17470 [Rhodococcus sp. MEB064]